MTNVRKFSLNSSSTFNVEVFDDDWNTFQCWELRKVAWQIPNSLYKHQVPHSQPSFIFFTSFTDCVAWIINSQYSYVVCCCTARTCECRMSPLAATVCFPANKLPNQVFVALESRVSLNHLKQRYMRGLPVSTSCDKAMRFKLHPDRDEKISRAKSIVSKWPHTTECKGRYYDGWLASVVDCLKSKRRAVGKIDMSRFVAIHNSKEAVCDQATDSCEANGLQPSSGGRILKISASAPLTGNRELSPDTPFSASQTVSKRLLSTKRLTCETYVADSSVNHTLMTYDNPAATCINSPSMEATEDNAASAPISEHETVTRSKELTSATTASELSVNSQPLLSCELAEVTNGCRTEIDAPYNYVKSCELLLHGEVLQSSQTPNISTKSAWVT